MVAQSCEFAKTDGELHGLGKQHMKLISYAVFKMFVCGVLQDREEVMKAWTEALMQ